MSENIKPENTAEEIKTPQAEEIAEAVEETVEGTVTEAAAEETETTPSEKAEENAEDTAETETEPEDTEESDEVSAEAVTVEGTEGTDTIAESEESKPVKKRRIQIPVIISVCIVALALIGYFIFTAFFLREPEGVVWSTELDGATYYFEFGKDNEFKAYVGSVEVTSTYEKSKTDEGNYLTIGTNVANFYSGTQATYEISGSRLLGNQTLDYSYGEGYDFSLKQSGRKDISLELPENFVPDEELLGEWNFRYYGYDIYKVTFNDDGSMVLEFVQDGIKYNGTYTIEDNNVNFTYYVSDSVAAPLEYSVDGDTLTFLGATFVRAGSEADEATPDQLLLTPAE